jgi:hypothetical protein
MRFHHTYALSRSVGESRRFSLHLFILVGAIGNPARDASE